MELLDNPQMIFSVVVAGMLLIASIIDIRHRKLSNELIIMVALIGLSYRLFMARSTDWVVPTAFLFIVGFIMWNFDAIGAADAKLLGAIGPMLPYHGLGETSLVVLLFIVVFTILTLVYSSLFMLSSTRKKKVPLVPVIFLTYLITHIIIFFNIAVQLAKESI